MPKRIRIVIAVLAVGGVLAWYFMRSPEGGDGALTASGTIEATDADLGFQLPGRVSTVSAREGDRVAQGDELARLDTSEIEAGVDAARAQLAAAEARLSELRGGARPQELATAEAGVRSATQRAEDATRDLERARTLHDGGAISRQALDKAMTALEVARAARDQAAEQLGLVSAGPRIETIRAQEALVEHARANLARVQATFANGVITAPFAGIVTIRHREPGEAVGPGTPVLTLLDPTDRWVRIYVREDEIGRVSIGQAARILSDSHPDDSYDGEVFFIGAEAEFTPRNVQTSEERIKLVYPVKVRITGDPDFELKPGVPADVTLAGAGLGEAPS